MSAAPQLFPSDSEDNARSMTVREAATVLGVAESTLRRVVKQAADAEGSATRVMCNYRGQEFSAWRKADRQPWRITFHQHLVQPLISDVSHDAVARVDGRIAELRVAMLPVTQEKALEHIPERPWWKFWAKS